MHHPLGSVGAGEPAVHDAREIDVVRPGVHDEGFVTRDLERVGQRVAHALAVREDEPSLAGGGLHGLDDARRRSPVNRAEPVVTATRRHRCGAVVEVPEVRAGELRNNARFVQQGDVAGENVGRAVGCRPPHRVRQKRPSSRPTVERDPIDAAPDEGTALLAVRLLERDSGGEHVSARVGDRGMDQVGRQLGDDADRYPDLAQRLALAAPEARDASERGSPFVPALREPRVELLAGHALAAAPANCVHVDRSDRRTRGVA
jgi:hypothetical protein